MSHSGRLSVRLPRAELPYHPNHRTHGTRQTLRWGSGVGEEAGGFWGKLWGWQTRVQTSLPGLGGVETGTEAGAVVGLCLLTVDTDIGPVAETFRHQAQS